LDAYLTVDDRRALVLLCRLEEHPEATAMAVKLLHSSDPDYGVSEFLKWLNSWDRKGNHLSIQHLKGRNSCNLCLTWLSKLVNQQYENF